MDRMTNINGDRLYLTTMRRLAAVRKAGRVSGEQCLGEWIAKQYTAMHTKGTPLRDFYEYIGGELQSCYGAWEYVHCGESETAYGVDWTCNDEDAVGTWAGWYYLRMQGYDVPATPDYDAICDRLGPAGEDVAAEVYGVVVDSVDYVKENGVRM